MGILKNILFILFLLAIAGHAIPTRAASPYAANGLGRQMPEDVGQARGMGGVGLAHADGINLMRTNPALLSGVDRYTFAFGATYSHERIEAVSGSETSAKTVPDFISIALPVYKGIVVGWSMTPYTRTDVKMLLKNTQNNIRIDDTLDMIGGINVSTASIAASFRNMVRIGYSLNYHFGSIQERWIRRFPENEDIIDTVFFLKRKYSGYSHTVGAIITPVSWLSLATSFTTGATLNNDNMAVIGSLTNNDTRLNRTTADIPVTIRAGVYASIGDRFEGGMDVSIERWEDAAVTETEMAMYNDSFNLGAGLRYVPETRPGKQYLKTMPLSLGFRMKTLYYKSYPVIDTVSEKAVSFGVEFPLKNELGSMFLTFETGTRGDKDTNGWDQLFTGFSIALIGKIL